MRVLLVVVMMFLLTGCSVLQEKMDNVVSESQVNSELGQVDTNPLPQLCCVPDPDFPHSCGGWLLCDKINDDSF